MGTARLSLALALAGACAQPSALELSGAGQALRPDDPGASELLFRFEPGDAVESYDGPGGSVRVHFTRAGVHAVALGGAGPDQVPADVLGAAALYEEVLAHQAALGFRAPLADQGTPGGDGGDGRFDVYLLDFASRADGTFVREACLSDAPSRCSGYAVQENDFAGYRYPDFATGTRILASHELFHAVQAAYDADQGSNFAEATAVWASEQFDPALSDFEAQIAGWLDNPERSIDQEPTGPVDPFSYGLALYVQYLDERFGAELIRKVWEGCEDGAGGVADPHWLDVLEARLQSEHDTRFATSFHEFASWALRSGLGGPQGSTFARAASYPRLARRVEDLPHVDERVRMFHASLRSFGFAPDGRSEVQVGLVGDADTLDGLALLVAARRGNELTVESGLAAQGEVAVDARGADELIVVLSNGSARGASKLPGLCIGTTEELTACRANLAGAVDAGASDAGPGDDAGTPPSAPESQGDGGCTLAVSRGRFAATWLVGSFALGLARRRRLRW